MRIGVPKEIKDHEYRVGLIPSSVRELVKRGHEIFIQSHAGEGVGFSDDVYRDAGAKIIEKTEELYSSVEMIVKVKEPQPEECKLLKKEQILFAFLHLAPDHRQAELLMQSGAVAIAYETVTDEQGRLPLLTPMSEIAGRLSVQAGAYCLEKMQGGRGILLGGVPGVPPSKVVIIGGGSVGSQALEVALGMGASVTLLDNSLERLRELDNLFNGKLVTRYANSENIEGSVIDSDLVIGAVLIPGGSAPKLVSREMLRKMRPGSVLVDVSIDQGGCFSTSRPTTHTNPTYIEEGIVHYCVTNMPGAVPLTSSLALNNVTLPFVSLLADKGYRKACLENPHLMDGLNVCEGKITHKTVAEALKLPYTPAESLLKGKIEHY